MPNEKPVSGQLDPILLWERALCKKVSAPVAKFDEDLAKLYQRLVATMGYCGAIGIAASQIGVFQQVAIVDLEGTRFVMVNPEILEAKGESTHWEGCLSLPGATGDGKKLANQGRVTRCSVVEFRYYDLEGNRKEAKATGFLAHAVMHEFDHGLGIYFIDHCGFMYRDLVMSKFRNFKKRLVPE